VSGQPAPRHFSDPAAGVQLLGAYGYTLQHSRHALLQVGDGAGARAWLRALLQHQGLATATIHRPPRRAPLTEAAPLNLGFTFAGLQALGLGAPLQAQLRLKAPAFAEGAVLRAARSLGDTGDSAAPHWAAPFGHRHAHLLLSLHADDAAALHHRWAAVRRLTGAASLTGWDQPIDGQHLTTTPGARTAHFGYRDGVANPPIRGLHRPDDDGDAHAPGEFLLGYDNDDRFNPWFLGAEPAAAAFFRNASFAAFRQMAQDEAGFQAWVADTARASGQAQEWVMAKLCGRWPDGRLMTADGRPPPGAGADGVPRNTFDFKADPQGLGCPFGAHIRRMNPRSDGLSQRQPRPLLRRGMPYGPRWRGDGSASDAQPRGLLGLFFCASLEDQFEHVLANWAMKNPLGPPHRGTAQDPLIGQHDDPAAVFDVPMPGGAPSLRWRGLRSFTTTVGTAYLLYPALPAVAMLAAESAAEVAS
jgi:deferrochelatase/peroxidase EfeB